VTGRAYITAAAPRRAAPRRAASWKSEPDSRGRVVRFFASLIASITGRGAL